MSAEFSACSICETAVPVVISTLVCCGSTCCLTCARDMFHLSGPSALSFVGPRKCSVCTAVNFAAQRDAHLFYRVQADLFSAVDTAHGNFDCPRGCNFTGTSASIWGHLRTGCDFATTKCSDCGATKIRGDLSTHRATECRRRRVCFCGKEAMCTLPSYKRHLEKHCQHMQYTQLCAMSAATVGTTDPELLKGMIQCASDLSTPSLYTMVSIGCGCGELFTLSEFVEHVASL